MEDTVLITSAGKMYEFGKQFSQKIKEGGVVALSGNLGAGKTTFVQGVARGLGITHRIISPTFIIVRSYVMNPRSFVCAQDDKNLQMFYHIDLYRTSGQKKQEYAEIEELTENPQNIVVIEWAERMEKWLPKKRWDLYFSYIDKEKREVKVHSR